jgi:hypothetical protein
MSSRTLLVSAFAVAATLAWQSVSAQASAPVSREQRKADTAAANKAGQLTPAGGGEAPKAKSTEKSSTVSRDQRKAETAQMNQEGKLAPAGGSLAEAPSGKASTKTKAQRAAEIEEARKKGEMVPAGGGHPIK